MLNIQALKFKLFFLIENGIKIVNFIKKILIVFNNISFLIIITCATALHKLVAILALFNLLFINISAKATLTYLLQKKFYNVNN